MSYLPIGQIKNYAIMKKIIIILGVLMLTNCVTESRMYQRQYSIKNESNQIVKLKFYLTSNNQLSNEITLNNTTTFNSEKIEFDQPHSNELNYIVPASAFRS